MNLLILFAFQQNTIYDNINENGSGSKKRGQCYSIYDESGCAICVSRDPTVQCGYCQSMGACLDGIISGSTTVTCPKEDWIFNKTKCDRSTCALAKTQDKCRSPCRWSSRRNECIIRRNLEVNSVQESHSQSTVNKSNVILIVSTIGVCAVIVIAVVGIVYKFSKPYYATLPEMKSDFTLDELPPA